MSSWETFTNLAYSASPSSWVQALFGLASCFVLSITVAPSAERKFLMNYGARNSHSPPTTGTADQHVKDNQEDALKKAVRKLTSVGQVPHALFFTFYASYLLSGTFWAVQYFSGGWQLRDWASRQAKSESVSSMSGGQVVIVWCLMMFQATRRLWECYAIMKPSKSTIWFVHWLMGLAYYLGVSIAIWIEGSGAVLQGQLRVTGNGLTADAKVKAAVALPLFFLGSLMQRRCHQHLASLKKYSLPNLGMFQYIVCPHYTCECLIYLSLAIAAAPTGQWCNRTILSVLLFTVVNLGATAHGTRNWYVEKFGQEQVGKKWTMIPFLF